MNARTDRMNSFLLYSLILHVAVFYVWGNIVVHKSVPLYGDHIEVSLEHFEFKSPAPVKDATGKKAVDKSRVKEKSRRPDPSLSLDGKKSPALSPEAAGSSSVRPAYGFTPRPGYPAVAIRRGYEGTVLVHVRVLPNGEPEAVSVMRSSGHRILDKAAVAAVKKWKFVPAQRGFKAVASWVQVPIEFRLD